MVDGWIEKGRDRGEGKRDRRMEGERGEGRRGRRLG